MRQPLTPEAQLRLALHPATPVQLALFPAREINRTKLILIRSKVFADMKAELDAGIKSSSTAESWKQLTKRCVNGA